MTDPVKKTKIAFEVKQADGKVSKRYLLYAGDTTTSSLVDLRGTATKLVEADDRFLNAGDIIEVDDEEALTISDLGTPIVVWKGGYIDVSNTPPPAPVPVADPAAADPVKLKITRKPQSLGGRDKDWSTTRGALDTMKLAELRGILVQKGWMLAEDLFLEQGAPKDTKEEESTLVSEITEGEKDPKTITLCSKSEAGIIREDDTSGDYKPKIDASAYQVNLNKPVLGDYVFAPDMTEGHGTGFGSIPLPLPKGDAVTLSDLTASQQQTLLENCRLYPRKGDTATCAALRVNEQIEFSGHNTIVCKKVILQSVEVMREDVISVSYSEEIRKWQSYMVQATKLGANVPLTAEAQAEGGSTQIDEEFSKDVRIHLSKVLSLPKAEVVLEEVSLSGTFVKALRKAVTAGSGSAVMDVLQQYGHFVATQFVLGAKLECTSSKVLTETCKRSELAWSFNVAASGAFTAQGVPVEVGAGAAADSSQKDELKKVKQTYELSVRTVGGYGEGSSSVMGSGNTPPAPAPAAAASTGAAATPPKTPVKDAVGNTTSVQGNKLADNWLITVATQPQTWRIIGLKGDIKPILDYLEDDGLKQSAKALLRKYFETNLVLKKSPLYGGSGGRDWDEKNLVKFDSKVSGYSIMSNQNIDSVRFDYRAADGTARQGAWHGDSRETEYPHAFGPTDEIVAIEVGWNKSIDHIEFHTRSGDNLGSVYGRGLGATHKHLFQELRIRGFYGRADHFLDAIGVYYYDLSNALPVTHRTGLLALERYLFR
jgi:hypothetical protein